MERVSTLMDGELDSDEAAREIARLKQDAARRDAWNTYHAIGELMRGEPVPAADSSSRFSRRLSEKLAREPAIVAPRLRLPATARSMQTYALSAAASVAAIAVVGWVAMTMSMPNPDAAPATLAQAPAGKSAAVLQSLAAPSQQESAITASEHVHEYLLAHQGISPTTAIQGVTPYIRTVSNLGNEPGLR